MKEREFPFRALGASDVTAGEGLGRPPLPGEVRACRECGEEVPTEKAYVNLYARMRCGARSASWYCEECAAAQDGELYDVLEFEGLIETNEAYR